MTDKVLKTINKYNMLEDCKNIVAGLSGGADSVCLLYVLNDIVKNTRLGIKSGIKITAAHVNHMLRGQRANEDEEYAAVLCDRMGIPLKIKRADAAAYAAEKGVSVEMAGREIRYGFFNEIAGELEKPKIAVAHNSGDRAETVLLNIIRGTGLKGLKGIPYARGNIIRPLLDVPKSEIRKFCADNKLEIREDESNLEKYYTRNKIRLELIPFINDKFNTDINEKLIKLCNNIAADDDFIDKAARSSAEKCVDFSKRSLNIEEFTPLHEAVKIRILQSLCENNLETCHTDKLIAFINTGGNGKTFEIPGKINARKEYGEVIFKNKYEIDRKTEYEYPLEDIIRAGTFYIKELAVNISCKVYKACTDDGKGNSGNIKNEKFSNNSLKQAFDYDKILGSAVRSRRSGDIFHPNKGAGRKKLSDYFIDKKIPARQRNEKILLAKDNDIAWIAGICPGKDFLPDSKTENIVLIEINEVSNGS